MWGVFQLRKRAENTAGGSRNSASENGELVVRTFVRTECLALNAVCFVCMSACMLRVPGVQHILSKQCFTLNLRILATHDGGCTSLEKYSWQPKQLKVCEIKVSLVRIQTFGLSYMHSDIQLYMHPDTQVVAPWCVLYSHRNQAHIRSCGRMSFATGPRRLSGVRLMLRKVAVSPTPPA